MVGGITKKNTWGGTLLKLIDCGGREEGITQTPECTEVCISRGFVIKKVSRSVKGFWFRRKYVENVSGHVECIMPK